MLFFLFSVLVALIAGFSREIYFVNESTGVQEICVNLTNPSSDQPLGLNVVLTYTTVTGSAGKIHPTTILEMDIISSYYHN